ncbi:hypothetical protein Mh1949_24420 [Mannheimia haemolytica]
MLSACADYQEYDKKDSKCYYSSYGSGEAKDSVRKRIEYNRCLRENKPYFISGNH